MDILNIKNEAQYEALRDTGYSKGKSARIANSANSGKKEARQNLMNIGQNKSFKVKHKMLILMDAQNE